MQDSIQTSAGRYKTISPSKEPHVSPAAMQGKFLAPLLAGAKRQQAEFGETCFGGPGNGGEWFKA